MEQEDKKEPVQYKAPQQASPFGPVIFLVLLLAITVGIWQCGSESVGQASEPPGNETGESDFSTGYAVGVAIPAVLEQGAELSETFL